MAALMAGCQAPAGGSTFAAGSVGDLARLDQICHYFVLTCNSVDGRDDVAVVARRQSAGVENTSAFVESDSIAGGWRKTVGQIERSADQLPFPAPAAHDWNALTRAVDRLRDRHWFIKLEKNGGWSITAKRRAEDELFGHTQRLDAADPDGLTSQINAYLNSLPR